MDPRFPLIQLFFKFGVVELSWREMGSVEMENKGEQEEVIGKGGELLFCGPTAWAKVRVKGSREGNLVTPTRFWSLMGINIRYVASGCGIETQILHLNVYKIYFCSWWKW